MKSPTWELGMGVLLASWVRYLDLFIFSAIHDGVPCWILKLGNLQYEIYRRGFISWLYIVIFDQIASSWMVQKTRDEDDEEEDYTTITVGPLKGAL